MASGPVGVVFGRAVSGSSGVVVVRLGSCVCPLLALLIYWRLISKLFSPHRTRGEPR